MTARAPAGTGPAGRALWRSVLAEYDLDVRELAILRAAAKQADDVRGLEEALTRDGLTVVGSQGQPRMNPMITELRQSRLALAKLLESIALPTADDRPVSRSQQRRSQQRWGVA